MLPSSLACEPRYFTEAWTLHVISNYLQPQKRDGNAENRYQQSIQEDVADYLIKGNTFTILPIHAELLLY